MHRRRQKPEGAIRPSAPVFDVRDVTVTDHRAPLVGLLFALPFAIYLIVAISRWGRTVGERAMHLRVVALDGSPPGWSRSVRRWAVLGVFSLLGVAIPLGLFALVPPAVVFGWMLIDKGRRQGLHDRAAGVIVVRVDDTPWPPPSPLY